MYTRLTRLTSPVATTMFFGPKFAVDYSPVWYSFSAFPRKIKPRVTGQMLVEKKPFDHWRVYPVVVFSGKLWEATFAADGELDVAPLEWVTYLHMYKGNPHPVDVVSFSYLEDYLESIGSEIVLLQKVLSGTQQPFFFELHASRAQHTATIGCRAVWHHYLIYIGKCF